MDLWMWCRSTSLLMIATNIGWAAFPSRTEILTPYGLRSISQLQVGDVVISLRHGREALRAIQSISCPYLKEGVLLETEGGQPLLCSADQLFWTVHGWQTAAELECGDQILTADGRWVPLVFPPLPHSLQAVEVCLEQAQEERSPNERVFWVGPQRLLCHNAVVLVPLVTIALSSGKIVTISGLTLAAAAAAFGSWWLCTELESRLNRLGFPDAHILSVDTAWMEMADADKEPLCMPLFEPGELKPWFEQPAHELGLPHIQPPAVQRAPVPLQWASLPPDIREALVAQLEWAVRQQLRPQSPSQPW